MNLYSTTWKSPIGELRIVVDEESRLCAIDFEGQARAESTTASAPKCDHVVRQLREYFAGERLEFELELAPVGTEFQKSAWRALQKIPYGRTASYQQQAERLGNPRAMRAVGQANGRNPIPIVVPCHRVIGKDGGLTGFGGGLSTKQRLLELEAKTLARRARPAERC